VTETFYLLAGIAGATRSSRAGLAEQALGDPECYTLLADTGRADEETRLWEPAGGERATQPVK
jgi:hypothetical protein